MKRRLSLILGSLALFLMIFAPSGFAQAEETDCECPGTVITGAERNKLVSNLLKSDEFKTVKKDLMKDGYKWQGADAIELRDLSELVPFNLKGYQVLFLDEAGKLHGAAFSLVDGQLAYGGIISLDDHQH